MGKRTVWGLILVALLAAGPILSPPAVQAQYQAAVPIFAQYTITATATALSSSGILNSTLTPREITVKNASGAANACYLGGQLVANSPTAAGVELAANQSYTFANQNPHHIYIVGTANAANIAFIVAEY